MITVDMGLLGVASGTVLPLLVGFVLHWSASPRIKAVTNTALSFVAALLVVATQHHGIVTKELLENFTITYIVSGSAHAHLWSPTGVTKFVQNLVPGFFKNSEVKKVEQEWKDIQARTARIQRAAAQAVAGMTPEARAEASEALHKTIAKTISQIPTVLREPLEPLEPLEEIVLNDPALAESAIWESDTTAGFQKARDILNS